MILHLNYFGFWSCTPRCYLSLLVFYSILRVRHETGCPQLAHLARFIEKPHLPQTVMLILCSSFETDLWPRHGLPQCLVYNVTQSWKGSGYSFGFCPFRVWFRHLLFVGPFTPHQYNPHLSHPFSIFFFGLRLLKFKNGWCSVPQSVWELHAFVTKPRSQLVLSCSGPIMWLRLMPHFATMEMNTHHSRWHLWGHFCAGLCWA